MLEKTSWYPFNDGPVSRMRRMEPRLSHPSIIIPSESKDGKWHMFAHTWIGIGHFISTSGLNWILDGYPFMNAKDPFVYREGKAFHLIYIEKKGLSDRIKKDKEKGYRVLISSSEDLFKWSEPKILFDSSQMALLSFARESGKISNPQLVFFEGKYRLYFTTGEVEVFDSKEKVSYALALAESDSLTGPYKLYSNSIMHTDPDSPYTSISIGSFRMIPCSDAVASIEASVFYDKSTERSRSALLLLKSTDGRSFAFSKKIHETPDEGWSSIMLTSLDLKFLEDDNTWYCYYSALSRREKFPFFKEENLGLLLGRIIKA